MIGFVVVMDIITMLITKCGQLAPNPATGYIVIELLDGYGRAIKTETIDRLPKPEPETTEE